MYTRIVIGSLLATFAFAPAIQAETLQHAVQQTVQTNPEVLAAVSKRLASDQAERGAKGGFLPTVDLNAGYGREKSENETTTALPNRNTRTLTRRELGARAVEELFTGFSTVHDVKRTRAEKEADAHAVDDVAEDTALRVVEVFVAVVHRQATVAAARQNVQVHQQTYKMIKKRADSGVSKSADVDQARGRLALAQANLSAEEGNLREARVQYARVVGEFPGKLVLPGQIKFGGTGHRYLPRTEQEAVDRAIANHPQLMAADADVVAAQEQHKLSQSTNYPRLNFELEANEDRDIDGIKGPNYDYQAMLRATYNIYNGGSDLARQRETAHLAQQATQIRNNTYRQVEENARLAWTALKTNKGLLKYYTEHRNASSATVKAYRKQFKLGQRTLLDLLDAENEYFTSTLSYLRANYDVIESKYRLIHSMGYLLEELAVLPPSEAYSQREAKELATKQAAEKEKLARAEAKAAGHPPIQVAKKATNKKAAKVAKAANKKSEKVAKATRDAKAATAKKQAAAATPIKSKKIISAKHNKPKQQRIAIAKQTKKKQVGA